MNETEQGRKAGAEVFTSPKEQEQTYESFLRSKMVIAQERGADFTGKLNKHLFPHQRDIAQWAIRGGSRAIFASFGLGKTLIQIQICQAVLEFATAGAGLSLVCCPLGVKGEFVRDAKKYFNLDWRYVRTNDELAELQFEGYRYFLTNYERIRDGNLDPNRFDVVSLDEASVLRSYGSKTYQTFLPLFDKVRFKFVATATPSPNRFKELIHYAGFLGVMDTGQALTRFFKRDSTQAGNLTLHPHKEREFWLWVSTWATFLTKPSDLGYDDTGYDLPPLNIQRHRLPVDHSTAGFDSWGQGKLLRDAAISLREAAREKRESILARVERMVRIVTGTEKGVLQRVLPEKQGEVSGVGPGILSEQQSPCTGTESTLAGAESGALQRVGTSKVGTEPRSGEDSQPGMVRKKQRSGQRNESKEQTAQVRADAGGIHCHAPETGRPLSDLPTTDENTGSGSRSRNRRRKGSAVPAVQCGIGGLSGQSDTVGAGNLLSQQFIVWCNLNDEQRAVESALDALGISYASLDGSMDIDERERLLDEWRDGKRQAFISKPLMYGAGVNLQQCHMALFLGLDYKFADFFQAIARIHRFLQTKPVDIHLIYTESEDAVHDILMKKWKQDDRLRENMQQIIRAYGLNSAGSKTEMQRSIGIQRQVAIGGLVLPQGQLPNAPTLWSRSVAAAAEVGADLSITPQALWTAANNDNVLELEPMADNSVDLAVTSWPFSNHYEYTESYNDFGHNIDDLRFFEQMDFLTPHLKRVLKPGRMYCVHCKDRLLYGSVTGLGMYSVNPFSDKCAAHLQKHGFIHCGRITIVTDVVRENSQTYRLGWSENAKDGTKMGVGSPEYILLFRKLPTDTGRAYADEPVAKPKEDYTRSRWQFDASPFWRSNGNRFLTPDQIKELPMETLRSAWHEFNARHIYDFKEHVAIAEILEKEGMLPASFMCLDPVSHSEWVWSDIVRMRTLNTEQARKRVEGHICPLQLDVVERLIVRYSNPGELVLDPFAGLMTVPYVAVLQGRRGYGVELNSEYWADGAGYCRAAELKVASPTLFDLTEGTK